jgi:hypothetical protein
MHQYWATCVDKGDGKNQRANKMFIQDLFLKIASFECVSTLDCTHVSQLKSVEVLLKAHSQLLRILEFYFKTFKLDFPVVRSQAYYCMLDRLVGNDSRDFKARPLCNHFTLAALVEPCCTTIA